MHTDREIKVMDMEVVQILHHSPGLFTLELRPLAEEKTEISYLPGQFVQLQIPSVEGVFLRRPFSIYYTRGDILGLLVQVAGKGTAALVSAKAGQVHSVIYPLGNHFSTPSGNTPILIGGGVGIAPLYSLGTWLKEQGVKDVHFLLGARAKEFFPDLSDFKELGTLHLTTEDGSAGETGFVTDHSVLKDPSIQVSDIYTCGPTPMMKAVARYARAYNIRCEASLENHMACGFGVCLCCVEPTTEGHKTVCTQGPVFDISDLKWE